MRRKLGVCVLAAIVAACDDSGSPPWTDVGLGLVLAQQPPLPAISLATPFAAGCDVVAASGTSYPDAEVEPMLAVNPLNAANLIGVWQQDRWSSGGAHGVLAAASFDAGDTWALRQAPFSRCSGGNVANDGDYARATDPWVSIGADGIAYWMALSLFVPQLPNAMIVSRSTDGGLSWEPPITLIADTAGPFNDKNAVTADPFTAGYAYAIWDRLDRTADRGPAWFSRTTDAGVSWDASKVIYDPGAGAQTIGNQIVVLPDGTLVNLLTEIPSGSGAAKLRVMRSTDRGVNWSSPVTVADLLAIGAFDPRNGAPIRDGGIVAEIAAGPTGMLYVVWQDSRFASGARDGIALSLSADGGLSWTTPVQVNGAPETQAFTPAIAVAADGTVAVSYFDLRGNTAAKSLPASYWLATSTDAVTWTERRAAPPFDLAHAPIAGGYFVGDYQGLKADATDFLLLFATANASTTNRTDVRFVRLPVVEAVVAKRGRPHAAIEASPVEMTEPWRARLADEIERSKHHFPDRDVPQYLRRG